MTQPPGFPVAAAPVAAAPVPAAPAAAAHPAWAVGISTAEVGNRGGDYFTDGHYIAAVDVIKIVDAQSGVSFFTVEMLINESTNPGVVDGARRSWQRNPLDKMGGPDCLEFLGFCYEGLMAKHGQPFDPAILKDPQAVMYAVSPEQPFRGQQFYVEVFTKPQKANPSKTFTHVRWTPVPAGTTLESMGILVASVLPAPVAAPVAVAPIQTTVAPPVAAAVPEMVPAPVAAPALPAGFAPPPGMPPGLFPGAAGS